MQLKITIYFALLEVGSINILIYIKGYLSQQCLKYPTKKAWRYPNLNIHQKRGGWISHRAFFVWNFMLLLKKKNAVHVGQSNGSDGLLCEQKSRGRKLCSILTLLWNSIDEKWHLYIHKYIFIFIISERKVRKNTHRANYSCWLIQFSGIKRRGEAAIPVF